MISKVILRNYKSFGAPTVVPLTPITVLVGPNNSGKSNFLSLGRLIANSVVDPAEALILEGGPKFLFHRPPFGDGELQIGWKTETGTYEILLKQDGKNILQMKELVDPKGEPTKQWKADKPDPDGINRPFARLRQLISQSPLQHDAPRAICRAVASARLIKLSITSLREDAEVRPEDELIFGNEGQGLAAIVGLWRGAYPDRMQQLESFVRSCVPEAESVLVRPAPKPSYQRLWIRQTDGQEFDAPHMSDGLLCFIALSMVAITAGPGAPIFIEEPEQSIHPQRIHDLVDLMRRVVKQQESQFVIATHSRVLVDQFRDEPEAILRFQRTEEGTQVERVSDIPDLLEALDRSPPGELLETGLFAALRGQEDSNGQH